MTYTDKDQVAALAGIFQSASLVHTLATTGKVSETLFDNCINTLFILNPDKVTDIYSHRALISGTGLLKNMLLKKTGHEQPHILRYTLSLIQLEIKLRKNTEMQDFIRQRINQTNRQKIHFEKMNDDYALNNTVISNLASLYKETISTMKPKIQVIGQPQYLQTDAVADKIRSLLLTGIRSAILWRQVGGKRLHLIFSRSRLLNAIDTQFDASI